MARQLTDRLMVRVSYRNPLAVLGLLSLLERLHSSESGVVLCGDAPALWVLQHAGAASEDGE